MIYKPENSLDIGAEEYGILCSQHHLAGSLADLLEGMIEDSGWTRPVTEHPMWGYIIRCRDNERKLIAYRDNEKERMRKHFSSR